MKEFFTYSSSCHSHSNAIAIERANLHHEKHYGLYVSSKTANVYIENVEHAQALIKALQQSIGLLFTKAQIDKHESPSCKTLADMIKATADPFTGLHEKDRRVLSLSDEMPFGKHKGIRLDMIESSYLKWVHENVDWVELDEEALEYALEEPVPDDDIPF